MEAVYFVGAFPLDHQFGLNQGFDVYSDRLPRGADGRLANERPAADVVTDAIAWLHQNSERRTTNDERRTANVERLMSLKRADRRWSAGGG